MGVLVILTCLAYIVILLWQIRALRGYWTSLLVVRGSHCFYVSGFSANDLLGMSDPQILDRKGKIFLVNGNEVRRLKTSELPAWLAQDELTAATRNLRTPCKICVVRNHALPRAMNS